MEPVRVFLLIFFLLSPISAETPALTPAPSASPKATTTSPAPKAAPKATTTPASSDPPNIITILQKAGGQFTTFIKLLRSTLVANQINTQLSGPTQGLTVFAPTDSAFSALGSGSLNSLSSEQQLHLIQYHVLPAVYSLSQFETITNPVHTQAGNSENGQYPLNITSAGNTVNISSGVVNATVTNTVYTDDQISVYQVDKVLLPLDIFGHKTVAPAPAPSKPEKAVEDTEAPAKPTEVPPPPSGSEGLFKKHSTAVMGVVFAMGVASVFWL
ncbi:hypothetical protein FNV43_RR16768 [Rhamnella rubrinervis]|uniref:FAS1 domain-containing protein n=1 Tax=Rhamnella rubrinervis TaxID=2594499 RepID=A0A8K0MDK3_9ROSA|nr:hypothetical protein FNV43_RR16768 [Rhamnella rubrinervis]